MKHVVYLGVGVVFLCLSMMVAPFLIIQPLAVTYGITLCYLIGRGLIGELD